MFVGTTYNKLCLVTAMMVYLAKRGQKKGMLFQFGDSRLLTRDHFVAQVRQALTAAGINCKPQQFHWMLSNLEIWVSSSLAPRMYSMYAALSHLPRGWIVAGGTPLLAAIVAAPILKL